MIPRLKFDDEEIRAPDLIETGKWFMAVFGFCISILMLAMLIWSIVAIDFKVADMIAEHHIAPASYQEACRHES